MPRKPAYASVPEYLAAQSPAVRAKLRRLRAAVRAAAPGARETMHRRMPSCSLAGQTFVAFAAHKRDLALCLMRRAILDAFAGHIAPYRTGKACLRFAAKDGLAPARLVALLHAAVSATRRGDPIAC